MQACKKNIAIEGVMEILLLGYSLNGKTMLKDKKFAMAEMPFFRVYSKQSTIDDVYEALRRSVEQSLESDIGLFLSGGLDSRIIAGLVAESTKDIVAFTFGGYNEQMIAKKVCSILKLHHVTVKLPPLDLELLAHIKKIVREMGGDYNLRETYVNTTLGKQLSRIGVKEVVSGIGFDEVNCGMNAAEVYSKASFIRFLVGRSHPFLPQKYREVVSRNLAEYCETIEFRKLFPSVIVRNRLLRQLKIREWIHRRAPLINSEVLGAICSLPYHERLNKRMQKKILCRYFPKLYRIPYSMSLLFPSFPYIVHRGVNKMVQELCIQTQLKRQCPLDTGGPSDYYFFRSNFRMLRLLLLKHLPPLFKLEDVKYLIDNLNSKNATLLNRMAIYSMICEQE